MPNGELYGYAAFRNTFIPGLVGRKAQGGQVQLTYPAGAPVVEIYGGRGTGKTALCEELYTSYVDGPVPVARWPLPAGSGEPAPEDGTELTDSPAVVALNWLVIALESDNIRFPRFTYGLVAVALLADTDGEGGDGDTADGGHGAGAGPRGAADFRSKLRELFRALTDATSENRLRSLFGELLQAAMPVIAALIPGAPNLDGLAQRLRDRYLAPRPQKRALDWWRGELGTYPGEGARRLLMYAAHLKLQTGAGARADLEERLARAFLADVDAHTGGRHWFPPPRALILIDDAHSGTSRKLLDLLLAAYVQIGGPGAARSAGNTTVQRPVIVATVAGVTERPASSTHSAPVCVSDVDTGLWASPADGTPGQWRLRMRTPALGPGSIGAEIGRLNCPRGLPDLIERLSMGGAGSAGILIRAARRDLGKHDSDLLRCAPSRLGEVLLTLPAAPADVPTGEPSQLREVLFGLPPLRRPTTCDALLWYLVPDDNPRSWLPRRAAALRLRTDHGRRLPLPPAAGENWAENPQQVRDFLREDLWDRQPWQGAGAFVPVVSDRALRELLVHQLRVQPAVPGGGDRSTASTVESVDAYWKSLHEAARSHYIWPNDATQQPERDGYLHHCLALGRRKTVVAALHQIFSRSSGRDWLSTVQFVCAAPHPPAGYAARHPEPDIPCQACDGGRPDSEHREINRMVTMLWEISTLSSVYEAPDSSDNPLRMLLHSLGVAFDDEDGAIRQAAARWPTLLAAGHRIPHLPIPSEAD
ncbi:hypothetical protein AB0I94_17990 [Streptomyces sp. NPDC050147]|uniref:hypothetical protein n=1 Tax=Streptomyces sp. NPDC050147 TaxID=3155513 RepID=UPI0034206FD1